MGTQLSFCFLAAEEYLPAPLPTVADIKYSQGPSLLDDRPGGVKVVRVNSHFAVKYGRLVDFIEGVNMVFVSESTNIRVPKLYAMFTEVSTDIKLIVMEYIPGKTLLRCWEGLDHEQKQLIATQLRQGFDELRSLPPPDPGYFGSLDRSGLRHSSSNMWMETRHSGAHSRQKTELSKHLWKRRDIPVGNWTRCMNRPTSWKLH